jgi:glyoxylase-like metal-dependent hydrolase (beta-lactamase superfamily II)
MLTLGEFRLHLINDGTIYMDPGGPFGLVPRVLWSRYLQPDDHGQLPMVTVNLLVEAGGKKIVIDTGHGHKYGDKYASQQRLNRSAGDLLAGLARLDVRPEDVDLVICTHLHGDHAGGNTRYDGSGAPVATFPNAEYVTQRREYEDALRPNERTAATYHPMNYEPLLTGGQLRLLDGDTLLLPGITGVVTPGHTPGHMSVMLESGGQSALFTCDMASYSIHFEKLGWMTAFDVEPLVTLETKRRWQRWALDYDALLIFPHDPLRPVGRLTRTDDGRLAITPVTEAYA